MPDLYLADGDVHTTAITLTAATRINCTAGTATVDAAARITGAYNLTFGGDGNLIVNAPFIPKGFSSSVPAKANVYKDGPGYVELRSTASEYDGPTVIISGTLGFVTPPNVNTGSSLGRPSSTSTNWTQLAHGAGLRHVGPTGVSYNRTIRVTANLQGAVIRFESSGAGLTLPNVNAPGTQPIQHQYGGQARTYQLGGTSTAYNKVDTLLTSNGSGAITIAKADSGLWAITNTANTYSGGTLVNGGTLHLPSASSVLGTGPVTVNGGKIQTSRGTPKGCFRYPSSLTFAANGRIRIGG